MENKTVDRTLLMNMTLVVEGLLLLAATFWSHMAGMDLKNHLAFDSHPLLIGMASGVALAICSFAMLWMGERYAVFASLREITFQQIGPIFAQLNALDVLLVAAISGFCEEIFFRGVMQEQLGLFITSAIFALFHCPSVRFVSYGIWAFCAGLFLGWLYIYTGNLWCPILAHAVSNGLSLMYLRYVAKPADTEIPPDDS